MVVEIYDDKDIFRILLRGLKDELHAIEFYAKNIPNLNMIDNKTKVRRLLLDSIKHADSISKELLIMQKDSKSKLTKRVVTGALKEEAVMKELYLYQQKKVGKSRIKNLLRNLSDSETKHQDLVKQLK